VAEHLVDELKVQDDAAAAAAAAAASTATAQWTADRQGDPSQDHHISAATECFGSARSD